MRGDEMDIDVVELDMFMPIRILGRLALKTKTTKTP